MDAYVLDDQFETVAFIDQYESFIWSDRYSEAGDFELYLPSESSILDNLKEGYYIWNSASDRMMIIETIEISTDTEEGSRTTVTGRSLESLLERRVIWGFTEISGNLQNGIQTLLNRNVISAGEGRNIPGFTFRASSDSKVTSITIENTQFLGDNLYEAIQTLCSSNHIGFRVLPDIENKGFIFELYAGVDRSYENEKAAAWVVFSPMYDNLLNSRYWESKKDYKNVALIGGEGDGASKIFENVTTDSAATGLARREVFISSNVSSDDGTELPDEPVLDADGDGEVTEEEQRDYDRKKADYDAAVAARDEKYRAALRSDGMNQLKELQTTQGIDGEVESRIQFVYGVDYFLGDIVQVENDYGKKCTSRVVEYVMTHDSNGETAIPTFMSTEDEKKGE